MRWSVRFDDPEVPWEWIDNQGEKVIRYADIETYLRRDGSARAFIPTDYKFSESRMHNSHFCQCYHDLNSSWCWILVTLGRHCRSICFVVSIDTQFPSSYRLILTPSALRKALRKPTTWSCEPWWTGPNAWSSPSRLPWCCRYGSLGESVRHWANIGLTSPFSTNPKVFMIFSQNLFSVRTILGSDYEFRSRSGMGVVKGLPRERLQIRFTKKIWLIWDINGSFR